MRKGEDTSALVKELVAMAIAYNEMLGRLMTRTMTAYDAAQTRVALLKEISKSAKSNPNQMTPEGADKSTQVKNLLAKAVRVETEFKPAIEAVNNQLAEHGFLQLMYEEFLGARPGDAASVSDERRRGRVRRGAWRPRASQCFRTSKSRCAPASSLIRIGIGHFFKRIGTV